MRNLILAILVIAACGPSNKDVALAKTAEYRGDQQTIFSTVKAVTESKYKLQQSDETTLSLQTVGRWYTPDGLLASERNGDMRDVPDRSINIALVVKVVPVGRDWVVHVEPLMMRYFAGRPNPDKLTPDDPSLPGWAHGKVDQLQFEIHDALKQYEVKTPGADTPPPAIAPASSPSADPGAAPPPATP